MATKRSTKAVRAGSYRLLDGRTIGLRGLTARETAFVADLRKMVGAGINYFEIERLALGPGSPALGGHNRITEKIVETPLYLVVEDIATRAGIEQGLVLAPEHETVRKVPGSDRSFISVVQAAGLIGISRTAVYKAIDRRTLGAMRAGNVTVVDRASAVAYRDRRAGQGGQGKHAA